MASSKVRLNIFSRAKDIEFTIRSSLDDKDVPLGADLRREVYLIFKECINNLVKHSECTEAAVTFSVSGPWLVVSITDNGKGFAPASNGNSPGMGGHGLSSMKRRAQALGGSLQIDSDVNRGTNVTLRRRSVRDQAGDAGDVARDLPKWAVTCDDSV